MRHRDMEEEEEEEEEDMHRMAARQREAKALEAPQARTGKAKKPSSAKGFFCKSLCVVFLAIAFPVLFPSAVIDLKMHLFRIGGMVTKKPSAFTEESAAEFLRSFEKAKALTRYSLTERLQRFRACPSWPSLPALGRTSRARTAFKPATRQRTATCTCR